MSLGVGEEFAGYTVVRRLGSGGMGEVYLAQHPRLPRQDALKLLSPSISSDPNFRARFLREAELAARLWHPHIVGVHDRGDDDGRLWIAMDFVDGTDAAELMSRKYPGGMPQELVVAVVAAVASALECAHGQGLLHRDVKPANIMISKLDDEAQRRVLLSDFGIARELDDAAGLTQTNMTLGTVAYAAPEQLMGEDIDGRADQYALAATAYHLLSGAAPFPQSSPAAVIAKKLNSEAPRLSASHPNLKALDAVLAGGMAIAPQDRFPTCFDFGRALAQAASGNPAAGTPQAPTVQAAVPPTAQPDREPAAPPISKTPDGGKRSATVGLRPAALLASVAIALGMLIIGALIGMWSRGGGSSSTASSSPTVAAPASGAVPAPSTVTVSVAPPSTVIKTVMPTAAATLPSVRPVETAWPAIIVDTCDEGGSCGVQQRVQPFNSAPKLYPQVLQDGSTVSVACQTEGDLRSSSGHGSSRVWFRLDNGSYINSVYTTLPPRGIPSC